MSSPDSSSAQYATLTTPSSERIRGAVVFMWSLMLIVVSLRFVARRLAKAVLWHDDWLIILAALSTTTCFASALWTTQQGLGRNLHTESEDQIENYVKGMFVSEAGWASTIFTVKCSILAFYWRLFNAKGPAFRFSIWAFLVLTVCWAIAVAVAPVFQCSPFHHYQLQITREGRCLDKTYWFFVGSSIPHIITDIALIGLPMFLIWDLQMSRSQKATLSAIFGLGGFVTIVAVVRLVYLIKTIANSASLTTNIANIIIWTGVEINMSIICACLPSLRPITSFISDKLMQLRKHTSTHKRDPRSLVARPSEAISVLPLFQTQKWDDGRHTNSHLSAEMEMEVKASKSPKETRYFK